MAIDPAQSSTHLRSDLDSISSEFSEFGWTIEPWPVEGTTIYISMSSKVDNRRWCLRFRCTNYPDEPPSIHCVNAVTKNQDDPSAWPQCQGFRPTSDLCMNISREGLMQLHPDWQRTGLRWNPNGNPILNVLLSIQYRLDDPTKYVPKP